MAEKKNLTIGLFGFGVVGEGIYKVLLQTPDLHATVKKICIRDGNKSRNAPKELFTTNPDELLLDVDINLIVELIDDADAAFSIVKKAFQQKKSVVSANKKLIAEHHQELLELQQQNEVSFLYEAAVCGSIPVIRNIEEYYDNDLLQSISGIVNGSTNYILTQMIQKGLPYETALKQAQQLGFAESNPTLDVEGFDALNKLIIVLKHAYGIHANAQNLLRKGITQIDAFDVQYAEEKGLKIKLVADAHLNEENEIVANVLPRFVDNSSQLFNVNNEYNGVVIGTKLADEQFLYGKGAGRFPTSSAVLSDISAFRYNYEYEYKKSAQKVKNSISEDYLIDIYVSFPSSFVIKKEDFEAIYELFTSNQRGYITGKLKANTLLNSDWFNHPNVSVIQLGNQKLKNEFEEEKIEIKTVLKTCLQ